MKHANRTAVIAAFSLILFATGAMMPLAAADKAAFAKYWTAAGKSYPAGKQFVMATAWAPGQYVITGTTTKGKQDSVCKQTIVRKEDGGWVFENWTLDSKGKETVSQMLLKGFDEAVKAGDASKISIGWMKMKNEDGTVQKIEGDQMAIFNAFFKSTYEKLVVNISVFTDGGTVTVPAGTFAGTNYQKSSIKIMGMKIATENWFNSAVPVNGIVKTQTSDGKSVTELLSFGFDAKGTLD